MKVIVENRGEPAAPTPPIKFPFLYEFSGCVYLRNGCDKEREDTTRPNYPLKDWLLRSPGGLVPQISARTQRETPNDAHAWARRLPLGTVVILENEF